jgi:hypothetical protein
VAKHSCTSWLETPSPRGRARRAAPHPTTSTVSLTLLLMPKHVEAARRSHPVRARARPTGLFS